uniref:Ig-like domain-containing protein n=1 Tax=Sphaeramia orbicularis TaxID=375764 RepID=A0A672ZDR6_9TELE
MLMFITLEYNVNFSTAFPEQHVDAVEGGSAFLNCLVDNQHNVEKLTVEWSKWSKDGVKECVHLYKHRKDQVADQDEKFRGKANLKHEGLKRGNVTLELQFVHLSDSGRYVCYIPRLDHHCYIILTIGKDDLSCTVCKNYLVRCLLCQS